MNKKFTNKNVKKLLDESVVANLKMGSQFYGTATEESDEDWLCIYLPPENHMRSAQQGATQLQWQDEFGDINYTDILTFSRNLISGDNTVNVEALYNKDLIGTDLEFFYINRKRFTTYNTLKCYLGLCKRDFNEVRSLSDYRSKVKKFMHGFRGYLFYKNLARGFELFDNNVIQLCKIKEQEFNNWLGDINTFKTVLNQELQKYLAVIDHERSLLNKKLDDGQIKKLPTLAFQEELDEYLNRYLSTLRIVQQQKKYIDLSPFYSTE